MTRYLQNPPFFIVGFSRSGTTLLAALMNRHSQICVTPESRFCRGVLPCGQIDLKPRSHAYITERVFSYWRTPDLGVSQSEFSALFGQSQASYASAFECLLECYRSKSGAAIVGEKSPIHLLYVPTLQSWFPGSRIVCILRDGRDVVQSMREAPFTHNQRPRHAAEWAYQSWLARKYSHEYAEFFLTVRYEDLLRQPVETLEAVCSHVGASFEAAQLHAVGQSDVVPDWEADWKRGAASPIDATKIALWRQRAPTGMDRFLYSIMRNELQSRGYETGESHTRRMLERITFRVLALPFRGSSYRLLRWLADAVRVFLGRMHLKEYR